MLTEYENVTIENIADGVSAYMNSTHIGNVKPCYPNDEKIKAIQEFFTLTINESAIISYYELSDEWQTEAKINLDEYAKETMYLEPDESANPNEHVLWSLNECMRIQGEHKGFTYHGVITISNNSAMLVKISDDGETANYIFV